MNIVPGIAFAEPLADADELYVLLQAEVEPTNEYVDFGRGPVAMPRLTAWYGDPGAVYTYTGLTNQPRPWTPALAALRERLNAQLGTALNSCLVGVYADGSKSVGWHADDEPELRDRIVSVSLGATRTFRIRERPRGTPLAIPLEHGSVLVMTVESQRRWLHAVPREPVSGPRMNLTFRTIAIP